MDYANKVIMRTGSIGMAVCLVIVLVQIPAACAQPGSYGQPGGFGQPGVFGQPGGDSRVKMKSYRLEETGEKIEYALFVSSKVKKKKKNKENEKYPLIMFLHGWGAGPAVFMRGKMLDLAQDEGYIVVAPMGYQPDAGFGAPMGSGPPGGGRKTQPKKAVKLGLNIDELSEMDAMNVLGLIREEYDIDESRKYIIGISAGGAGAIHLGVKYVEEWAAIAAVAPAAFYLQPAMLEPVKDSLPVVIVQGDADTVVPVRQAQRWVSKMQELEMTYKYYEVQGGGHGNVLNPAMPHIFAFFKEHTKFLPEQ